MGDESPFQTILAGASLLFLGRVVSLGLGFVLTALIARYLGPDLFGQIAIGKTLLALLTIFSVLGIKSGIGRYLPRYNDSAKRRGILVSGSKIVLSVSIGVAGILFSAAGWLATAVFNDPDLAIIIRIFAVAIPFASLKDLSIGGVQGMKHSLPKVIIEDVSPPVTKLLCIGGVILFGLGVLEIAWAFVAGSVVGAMFGLYYLWNHTALTATVTPVPMGRELIGFSVPLMISAAMMAIFGNIDTILLGSIATTDAVGVYNAVYPIGMLLTITLSVFGFIALPIVSEYHSEGRHERVSHIYYMITRLLILITLPAFIILILFPRIIISITFGQQYTSGATALAILTVGFFAHTAVGMNGKLLTAIGQTRLLMYDDIVSALLNIGLNILLIPKFSILGAAIATTVCYIIRNALYSTHLYMYSGILPVDRSVVMPAVGGIFIAFSIYTIISIIDEVSLLSFTLFIFTFGTFYLIILIRLGGFKGSEDDLLSIIESQVGVDLSWAR